MEAVRKAEELQPDLILMDLGLPTLSGIEAARRICKLPNKSKIVFVSQESSADIVLEAFCLGALGYVLKSRAGTDLLPAVEAVLEGRHFVSRALLDDHSTETADAQGPHTSWTLNKRQATLRPMRSAFSLSRRNSFSGRVNCVNPNLCKPEHLGIRVHSGRRDSRSRGNGCLSPKEIPSDCSSCIMDNS